MQHSTQSDTPATWQVRYITPEGFEATLTLTGQDVVKVMATAKTAVESMVKAGCKPTNGHTTAANPASEGAPSQTAAPSCPTHGKAMKLSAHGGGWFCPVKIADDDGTGKPVYCKQKVAQ